MRTVATEPSVRVVLVRAAALSTVASAFRYHPLLRSGNAPAPADPVRLA
jgi:hypothetical protein